ncbi:MAG: class I SAM-dependent methyltransferase [Elusimicrobiales bacterium]|nr:class I SAM-dependent methyltransferase [Elusimicrobiales bacterium]
MKFRLKDLLLMALVFAAMAALLVLAYQFRRDGWLFWALAVLAAPSLAAFIFGAPFVPATMEAARGMTEAAGLKPGETVYDIGCGDGRVVYLAVRDYGVKGVGIELSPLVYLLARARGLLWRSGAEIKLGDFRWHDLSGADAVFCYLSGDVLAALETKLKKELRPGARVVSLVYRFPSWKESRSLTCGGLPVRVYIKE